MPAFRTRTRPSTAGKTTSTTTSASSPRARTSSLAASSTWPTDRFARHLGLGGGMISERTEHSRRDWTNRRENHANGDIKARLTEGLIHGVSCPSAGKIRVHISSRYGTEKNVLYEQPTVPKFWACSNLLPRVRSLVLWLSLRGPKCRRTRILSVAETVCWEEMLHALGALERAGEFCENS